MSKYISNNLCRLIRERAYSSGNLALLDQEEAELENIFVQQRQRFREIRLAKKKLIVYLAKIDAEITQQLPVDPENIKSVRHTPRFGLKHGSIVASIVRILTSTPEPVRTTDMVKALVAEFGWPYSSKKDREVARKKVAKPLGVLAMKGAVIRLHRLQFWLAVLSVATFFATASQVYLAYKAISPPASCSPEPVTKPQSTVIQVTPSKKPN